MLSDFEGGRALDRALDRQERRRRGEPEPPRRSRSSKGAVLAFMLLLAVLLQVPYHMQQGEQNSTAAPATQKQ